MAGRATRLALYLGALLGPLGGGVIAAILPEVGASFGVSAGVAASSLTAYLLPFAGLMLVSGTLGERWGQARTIRVAYVVYAVAALAAALVPWFWLFQVTRGVQGAANAFTLPLLMAKIASSAPPERLGRALGLVGAMQAAGQTSAPLVGGLAAEASWRWAFAGIAVVAVGLACCRLPPDAPAGGSPPRLREAWRASVVLPGLVAMIGWACLSGISFLVAFRMEDTFGLSASLRGLVLTGFGVAGFATARLVGAVADRAGPRATAITGLLLGSALVAAIGLVGSLPLAAAGWAASGICGQFVMVAVNATVLTGDGQGRGGAISVVQAMRFAGMAAAPAVFTSPYQQDPVLGFLLPAALLALAVPLALRLGQPRHSSRRIGTAPRSRLRHSRG